LWVASMTRARRRKLWPMASTAAALLLLTLAGCGGGSSAPPAPSVKLATAELQNSDLPNGFVLVATSLFPRYTTSMTAAGTQLTCTTPQSLSSSNWQQGLIQVAQAIQSVDVFQECGFTVNSSGDSSSIYQDLVQHDIPSYLQRVSTQTIGDESTLASLKPNPQVRGEVYQLIFRHGNAVIALFHSVSTQSPLSLAQFEQLGRRINSRIK